MEVMLNNKVLVSNIQHGQARELNKNSAPPLDMQG